MLKKKKNQLLTYGIVGVGRFGTALAHSLAESGAEILVLDRDEEKIKAMREHTENAYVIKTLDKQSLLQTGIQNCDVAVVCIGEKIDTSILTTLNLISFGIPTVIAKASSIEHGEVLEKLGAEVVYPERDMAVRLANRLEAAKVLDFIQLSERINISKVMLPAHGVGKSVRELNIRALFGLNIIAILNGSSVIDHVTPDYIFKTGDTLVVSGSRESLMDFASWEE